MISFNRYYTETVCVSDPVLYLFAFC